MINYNPLKDQVYLYSDVPKDHVGNPFKPKEKSSDISRKTIVKGIIALYLGKKLYENIKNKLGSSKLKSIEKLLGKKCIIKLDLYDSERDASIVESTVLKFNEVLSSPNPKSVIQSDLDDYKIYYIASMRAIDRSSPDPVSDKDYITTAYETIKYLGENEY